MVLATASLPPSFNKSQKSQVCPASSGTANRPVTAFAAAVAACRPGLLPSVFMSLSARRSSSVLGVSCLIEIDGLEIPAVHCRDSRQPGRMNRGGDGSHTFTYKDKFRTG